eukprot:Amastigsp_a346974_6.p4 type:complete len:118 gc:universal Amastigsp_a346974_6:71-424(+)
MFLSTASRSSCMCSTLAAPGPPFASSGATRSSTMWCILTRRLAVRGFISLGAPSKMVRTLRTLRTSLFSTPSTGASWSSPLPASRTLQAWRTLRSSRTRCVVAGVRSRRRARPASTF